MRKGLFILVMLLPTLCFCQDKKPIIKPYVGYLGFFDNREFYQSGLQPSTYFGQRISPGITAQLDTANLMVLSVNFLQEFGNPKLISGWQPEVYFRHQSPGLHFVFGAFPREKWADTLALALVSDSLRYTRPNATGFAIKQSRKNGHSSVWLDWSGQKTERLREQFFIGTHHLGLFKSFFWQIDASLTHVAKSLAPPPEQSIEEQAAWLTQIGKSFNWKPIHGKLAIGWLSSWERVRNGSPIQTPQSLWLQGGLAFRQVDIQHTRKHGEKHELSVGDPFYRFANYHRTDVRYQVQNKGKWKIEAIYSLHRADRVVSHQQRLLIRFDW